MVNCGQGLYCDHESLVCRKQTELVKVCVEDNECPQWANCVGLNEETKQGICRPTMYQGFGDSCLYASECAQDLTCLDGTCTNPRYPLCTINIDYSDQRGCGASEFCNNITRTCAPRAAIDEPCLINTNYRGEVNYGCQLNLTCMPNAYPFNQTNALDSRFVGLQGEFGANLQDFQEIR
eukprot:gene4407-5162_t